MDNQSSKSLRDLSNETRSERKHLTDLDQIIKRHLNDEHDKITEEDIRDAVIGFPREESAVAMELPSDSKQFFPEGESDHPKAG